MKLVYVLIIVLYCSSCSQKSEKIQPLEQALTESVYATATIQPDSLYQVYAIVSGILDANLVKEGDIVKKDQAIIEIINNTPQLNTENAKYTLDLAKDNYYGKDAILSSIKNEIEATVLRYKNDSINYYRQKNLWDQNIGSKTQYDAKKLNYELSSKSLKLLKNNYNRTKNELHTNLKQAQNNYQASLIVSKDFTIKSKIDGKLYALYKEPGEIVNSMEPLASIGSATNFIIELLIDEVDIVSIKEGLDVLVTLDAYEGELFKGSVSKIFPKKDERNQTFKVEANFEMPPQILYPGLSGEANIIIAKKDKVLTIPRAYIIDGNKVKTDSGLKSISIGIQNMEYVEILSGIAKSTYIYKPE